MKWIIDGFEVIMLKYPTSIFDYRSRTFLKRGPTYANEMVLKCKIKCEYKDSKKGSKYLIFSISEEDMIKQKTLSSFETLMKTFFEMCVIDFINIMPTYVLKEFPTNKNKYEIFGKPENIARMVYYQKETIFIRMFNRIQSEQVITNIEKDTKIHHILNEILWDRD